MIIKNAEALDIQKLNELYDAAFESNSRFFPDNMELSEEEEDDGYSLEMAISMPNKTLCSIWVDGNLIGGASISSEGEGVFSLDRLFIGPEFQGKGYGLTAWNEIERRNSAAKEWRLTTPTCLINNVCFYVNKCGFSIIRVEDMAADGVGMYVFRKVIVK